MSREVRTKDAGGGSGPAPDGGPRTDEARAVAFCQRSTQNRPQTEAELAAKLSTRGFSDEVVTAALGRARRLGIVDDAAFARAWVSDRGQKRGYGAARLRQELRRRQVPEDVACDALAVLQDRDEFATALDLAARRLQGLPPTLEPEVAARRLDGFLLRRGYSPAVAHRAAIVVSGLDRHWD